MEIKALQVGYLGTNCYLICDEKNKICAVVDPGGDPEKVASQVESAGYKACAVLLTHGHYDHTGGVEELMARWGVPAYLNHRDIYPNADIRTQRMYPYVAGTTDYDEGDTVKVGDLTVEVMATPGHSKGGVTLRCGDALVCGDTLFAGSMGRTDLAGGSQEEIMSSLRRLSQLEGNYKVYPGHMGVSDLDTERASNPYMKQAMR